MAIQMLSFSSLILRPSVKQEIDKVGWESLMNYADPERNFDGEIMAFGAMSGDYIEEVREDLVGYGYIGPDNGEESDMVIYEMLNGDESNLPSWLELVDVTFFDNNLHAVRAWKKKESNVNKLLNFEASIEADISLPTKGYECDWPPHIGKIK